MRDEIRANTTRFLEVFVDCPTEVAEQRDTAGLYARARAGELQEFTGVNAPYEAPESPEVHIHADRESVEEAASRVLKALEEMEVVPRERGEGGPASDYVRQRLAAIGYI